MNYKNCPICKEVPIYFSSESIRAGACAKCRDATIPKHILLEQHKQYVKLYLQKRDH